MGGTAADFAILVCINQGMDAMEASDAVVSVLIQALRPCWLPTVQEHGR